MKIDKSEPFVKIEIENLGKYLDVALLVDKVKFRRLIPKLRKEYMIDTPFPSLKVQQDYRNFYIKLTGDNKIKEKFDAEVENIRKEFNRPTHFNKVIYKAIVVGTIKDSDYMSAYLEEQVTNPPDDPRSAPEDIKYAIIISSVTKKVDVESVFSDFLKRVKKNYSKKHQNPGYQAFFEPRIYTDSKDAIKQDREWYVKRKRGTTLLELALFDNKSTLQEYKIMQIKSKTDKTLSDSDSDKVERYLQKIDTSKKRIKTQLSRYSKLLERL